MVDTLLKKEKQKRRKEMVDKDWSRKSSYHAEAQETWCAISREQRTSIYKRYIEKIL